MSTYSFIERAFNKLKTIDLDRAGSWPQAVSVVSADEFGPLVISIADATVFSDGSVQSGGRWITSARFGLAAPTRRPTDVLAIDTECVVVTEHRPVQRDLIESVGPRLATLGRTRPGLPVLFPPTRHPLTETVKRCSLTPAGVLVNRGAARTVPAALFARLPVTGDPDGQQRQFAEIFHSDTTDKAATLYLHADSAVAEGADSTSVIDRRHEYEIAGATLVPASQFYPGDVTRLATVIASASTVVLETPELQPFALFASPNSDVTLATTTPTSKRDPARVTARTRFDMDDALRTGATLPRGVEILSRPDYDVADISVDAHRVFVDGKWRAQADDVLVQKSLGPWIVSVRNAFVAPNGSAVLEDGTQLGGGYFGEDTNAPPVDGWVIDEASRPSGLGLTIHKAFGHGLLQVAPRLDALMQHDSTMDVLVPDFTWDDSALLARVGVDARRVRRVSRNNRHHLVRVPELIVSTHLHPEQYTARADPKWQAEFVSRFVGETTVTPSRRVHFARRDTSGERGGCVNRHVLNNLAAEFGYEEVFPELMSFDEQVELVASTVDVFGERGSALNWSLFMPSGSQTVLVNSKAMNRKDSHVTFHNPVLAARGSQYREINAVRAGTPNFFEVDPHSVRRALEEMS